MTDAEGPRLRDDDRPSSNAPLPFPRSLWIDLAAILVPTLVVTFVASALGLDESIARSVLDRRAQIGWIGYDLGNLSFVVGALLLVAMCVPALRRRWPLFVRCGAVFVMTLIIAVMGFIQNTKRELDRPRPNEVREFGGQYAMTGPFGSDPACSSCTAFPSSAAGAAFLLCTPYFVLRRSHRGVAVGFLVAGLAWGSFVGYARLVPGLHWFTDVVWAATFVLVTASALAHVDVRWRSISPGS